MSSTVARVDAESSLDLPVPACVRAAAKKEQKRQTMASENHRPNF